ncbi:hypothetical protein N476_17210 [Pseudoalteromonas luteoviolacea H33]|uniref:Ig-like domain-containing protein n=3 Tax=Pseudoalteromonas luteoviolacea TaxID=43657 RepID=A0A161Y4A0_9GAMM|nr:hypothetical protein N476_17210 [Pseudoalteromonas luteoviolacea H33]KZN76341.1 hypothetical protein N477_16680 [Pseudoalteromonas luteoviolacea H33-S]
MGCGGSSEEPKPQSTSTETSMVTPQPTVPEPQPTVPEPQPIVPDNQKPTVGIEGEPSGQERQTLVLVANASDIDGSIASYQWQHNSELTISLTGVDSQKLEIITPDIQKDTDITFTVTVTDNHGATETATHSVTFERNEIVVQLQGLVTDQPIPDATVTATIGDEQFTATANAQGEYTLDIVVDESSQAALVELHAQGAGAQSRVEFVSQLPSMDVVVSKAGEDKVLLATELFGVNITNVTTAEYVQLSEHEGAFDSQAQFQDTLLLVDTTEKMKLATLIKALVDNNIELMPAQFSSTLSLARDSVGAEQLYSVLEMTHPELLTKASEELLKDTTLLPGFASELTGDYILTIPNNMHGLLANLSFNEDGTGTIVTVETSNFHWEKIGQVITLSFAEPVEVVPQGIQSDYGPSAKTVLNNLTLTLLEERSGLIISQVSYEYDLIIEFLPDPIRFNVDAFAHLLQTTSSAPLDEEAMVGVWHVQHHMLGHSFGEAVKLELFEDGTANQDSGNISWQWQLTETELVLESGNKKLTYQVLDHASGSFNTMVVGHLKETDSIINGAMFVKQQALSFDSFDFIGSWMSTNSQNASQQMLFFEDNSYLIQINYSNVWTLEQGKLELGAFFWNEENVNHCDTAQKSCQFRSSGVFELVGVFGNDIAVKHIQSTHHYGAEPEFQSYLKFFTVHTEDGQQLLNNLMPHGFTSMLYGQNDTLKFEMDCFNGPCHLVIEYKDIAYRVEDKGSYLVLSNDAGEQLLLSMRALSSTEFAVCIRFTSGQCDESNTAVFSSEGPELDFSVTIEGQGELITHTDKPRLGKLLSLTVEPGNGYVVSDISGCNGYFQKHSLRFEAYTPTMSCHIKAKFIKESDFIGQLRLLRKGFYAPEHFDIDVRPSGDGRVSRVNLYSNFTWQATEDGGITAQLTQPVKVSVDRLTDNSDIYYDVEITGFDLKNHAEGVEVTWHRQLSKDGEVHRADSLVDVLDDIRDFTNVSLTEAHFVGAWSLGYGEAEYYYFSKHQDKDEFLSWSEAYQLVLKENGEGEIQNDGKTTSINWSWHGNYIEIVEKDGYNNTVHISLLSELDGGYQFNADFENLPYSATLNNGAGVMVKHQIRAPEIANTVSVWRFKNGPELEVLDGMELYTNGVARMGAAVRYSHTYFDDNKLYLQDFWNVETNQRDTNCTIEQPECVEQAYQRITPLAQGERTLFALSAIKTIDGQAESSRLRVIARGGEGSFTQFEPFMLSNFSLYERAGENISHWRTWYSNGIYKILTPYGEGDTQIDEAGRIKYGYQGEYYYIQLLAASSDGLKVCHYAESDACTEANETFLSYQ